MTATTTTTTATATAAVLPGDLFPASVPGYGPHYAPMVPLIGSALLAHTERLVEAFGGSRTDLVRAAGYIRPDGRVRYVDFYEQLLAAKGIEPTLTKDEDEDYEELSENQKELYDVIHADLGEKWDHYEIMEMLEKVNTEMGIETAETFRDCFAGRFDDGWNWQAEYAEEYYVESGIINDDSPVFFAVDWQKVWDHQLEYDFSYIEFDGEIFLFRNDY